MFLLNMHLIININIIISLKNVLNMVQKVPFLSFKGLNKKKNTVPAKKLIIKF